jgi:ribosomal protein S18 acetylase RimI-like enzyme
VQQNMVFLTRRHLAHLEAGVWLYVWKENHRAVAFYQKMGFEIVGEGLFKISETHYNPNHVMYLDTSY